MIERQEESPKWGVTTKALVALAVMMIVAGMLVRFQHVIPILAGPNLDHHHRPRRAVHVCKAEDALGFGGDNRDAAVRPAPDWSFDGTGFRNRTAASGVIPHRSAIPARFTRPT
jgi:hypothetical protein